MGLVGRINTNTNYSRFVRTKKSDSFYLTECRRCDNRIRIGRVKNCWPANVPSAQFRNAFFLRLLFSGRFNLYAPASKMAKVWTYVFVMLWMLLLIGTGVHLFSKGFLLSRHAQIERNECIRLKPCEWSESEVNHEYTFFFVNFITVLRSFSRHIVCTKRKSMKF